MFSFKRASGKAVLIADVDDASVGVAIVRVPKDGPLAILVSERKRLTIEDRTPEQRASGVLQLLDACTDSVLKTYHASDTKHSPAIPRDVYVIVRSAWSRFRTARAEEVLEKPRTVTKEYLSTLAKKALAESSDFDRANIIESGVLNVNVNGYRTDNPLGKKGVRVSVVAFESDIQAEIKRGITQTLGKYLPGRQPIIASGMRSMLTVLYDQMPNAHGYVVMEMGNIQSTCIVIHDDSVSGSGVVPEGLMTIAKRLSGAGIPEEIISQLRMLGTDICATDACKALKDLLARLEPELVKAFGDVFSAFALQKRMPNTIMLIAPTELTPWLQGFLSRIDFAQFTITLQPFTIELVSSYEVNVRVDWKGLPADTGITTAAKYVHILAHES